MTSMTELPEGTLARLTRDVPADFAGDPHPKGFEFEVADYFEGIQPGRPGYGDPDVITEPMYYGNANGGWGNVCVPADAVEIVRTAEEQRARRVPSLRDVAEHIGSSALSHGDGIDFDESEVVGDAGEVELVGLTAEGLRFVATVIVRSVYRVTE